MKFVRLFIATAFVILAHIVAVKADPAANKPKFVSATFQNILKRVSQRDKATDAILEVKGLDDSSRRNAPLNFSMRKERDFDDVIIELSWGNKLNDGTYEKYRLTLDDAMTEDLAKQERHMEAVRARVKKDREETEAEITKLTGGTLKLGNTAPEVEAISKPLKVEKVLATWAGARLENWIYEDLTLYFSQGLLARAFPTIKTEAVPVGQ